MHSEYILSGPPDIPLEDCNQNLGEFFLRRLTAHGNRSAQVDAATEKCRTYEEIRNFSLSLAEAMRYGFGSGKWHLGTGSCISICSENTIDFCIPVMAAVFLGVASAPLNPAYTERELKHALSISKPKVIFCSKSKVKDIFGVAQMCEFVKQIVVMDEIGNRGSRSSSWEEYSKGGLVISINDMLFVEDKFVPTIPFERDLPKANLEDVALIMCSSGTTGLPKGVMLTQRNIVTSISHLQDERFMGKDQDEVYLSILPFFHAFGIVTALKLIAVGVKAVLMTRFEPDLFLKSIEKHKVNVLPLVPPLLVFLTKHPQVPRYDLSSVTYIFSGAAPLGKDVQQKVEDLINRQRSPLGLPPMQVRQGYGLTETTLGVLLSSPDKNKHGSAGILAPGTQGKVIDMESGKALGPNKEGELCFRGALIMKGYAGNPAATSAMIDGDGWLHSGDVGYYDEDGVFYVVDRLKELIKYKGFQVPPAELEALLLTHPDVEDSAVIGIPDEVAGELPLAFVVKRQGKNISEDEIIKFVAGRVSPQKRLHGGVKFVESIPKTASGKILRRELRDRLKSKL